MIGRCTLMKTSTSVEVFYWACMMQDESCCFVMTRIPFVKILKDVHDRLQSEIMRSYWRLIVAFYTAKGKLVRRPQVELARAYLNSGRPQATIELCNQLNPSDSLLVLADAYHRLGQWQDAVATNLKAIELNPNNPELHHYLGKRYGLQDQYLNAIVAYEYAIELNLNNPWFHYSLGIALVKTGDWHRAIETLQLAQRSLPREVWISYYLGEAFLAMGNIDGAIVGYERALRRSPWMLYLWDCLAYARHMQWQDQRIIQFCNTDQASQSSKRRMLMITPYPTYPPTTGAIARMFHEMQAMGKQYDLTVVSFVFEKRDFKIERDLFDYCQFAITVVIGDSPAQLLNQPNLVHEYSSERMLRVLSKLQSIPFDMVLTDFIQMAQYQFLFPNAFHVLSEHNIESELLRRSAQFQSQTELQVLASQHTSFRRFLGGVREADRLAEYEAETWLKFPLRMVVSEQDGQLLNRFCGIGKTIVVSNGIDTKTIQVLPDNPNKVILFIGTLSYYPNIDGVQYFVQEILPLIWEKDSSVQFWIAGAEPPQSLLDLTIDGRIKVIANPKDMTIVARQCCVTVVPLRIGSGTRIKILHGMAMGLPIVTTSLGCEGIAVRDGCDVWVRDRPVEFAAATLELLRDEQRRQQFRNAGRALVEWDYDWAAIFAGAINRIEAEFEQTSIS